MTPATIRQVQHNLAEVLIMIVSFDDRQIKAARLAHMQVFVPR